MFVLHVQPIVQYVPELVLVQQVRMDTLSQVVPQQHVLLIVKYVPPLLFVQQVKTDTLSLVVPHQHVLLIVKYVAPQLLVQQLITDIIYNQLHQSLVQPILLDVPHQMEQ